MDPQIAAVIVALFGGGAVAKIVDSFFSRGRKVAEEELAAARQRVSEKQRQIEDERRADVANGLEAEQLFRRAISLIEIQGQQIMSLASQISDLRDELAGARDEIRELRAHLPEDVVVPARRNRRTTTETPPADRAA